MTASARPRRTVTVISTPRPVNHALPDPCQSEDQNTVGAPLRCYGIPSRLVDGEAARNTVAWRFGEDTFVVAGQADAGNNAVWGLWRRHGGHWRRLYGARWPSASLPSANFGSSLDGGSVVLVTGSEGSDCGSGVLLRLAGSQVQPLLVRRSVCQSFRLDGRVLVQDGRVGPCPLRPAAAICSAGNRTVVRGWVGRREVVHRSKTACSAQDGDPGHACRSACRMSLRQVGPSSRSRATLELHNTSSITCHLQDVQLVTLSPWRLRVAGGRTHGVRALAPGGRARLALTAGQGHRRCGTVRRLRISWWTTTVATRLRVRLRSCGAAHLGPIVTSS